MTSPMLLSLLAAAALAGLAPVGPAVPAPQDDRSQVAFRGRVDVVTLVVSVLNRDGHPERGLTPEDFTVTLDGVRRQVLAADYHESGAVAVDGLTRSRRVWHFLVDDLSWEPSAPELIALRASAAALLDRLPSNDLVGLTTTSGIGPAIGPTTDHQRIRDGLGIIVGRAEVPHPADTYISVPEAIDIHARSRGPVAQAVITRECVGLGFFNCPQYIEQLSRELIMRTEARAARQLSAFRRMVAAVAAEPGFPIAVLMTRGLPPVADLTLSRELADVGTLAREAGVLIYGITPGPEHAPVEERGGERTIARTREFTFLRGGAEDAVAAAGGTRLRMAGPTDRLFDRMLTETAGVYELAVEAPIVRVRLELDAEVRVRGRDLVVRAGHKAVLGGSSVPVVAGDPLGEALVRGEGTVALPLAVATSIHRRPRVAAGELELRVVVAAPAEMPAPLRVGYAVLDSSGRATRSSVSPVPESEGREARPVAFPIVLPVGAYQLRLAVADALGRVASFEQPIDVGLRPIGPVLASELRLSWIDEAGAPHPVFLSRVPAAAVAVTAAIDLYDAPDGPPRAPVTGRLAIASLDRRETLDERDLEPQRQGDAVRIATQIRASELPPGRYRVSVEVLEGGEARGVVSVVFIKTS